MDKIKIEDVKDWSEDWDKVSFWDIVKISHIESNGSSKHIIGI